MGAKTIVNLESLIHSCVVNMRITTTPIIKTKKKDQKTLELSVNIIKSKNNIQRIVRTLNLMIESMMPT